MAKVKELTDIVLNEVAPYIDEVIVCMFEEIDEDPYLSFEEKQFAKKKGMSALTKGLIGAGAAGTGLVGALATKGGARFAQKGLRAVGGLGKPGGTISKVGGFIQKHGTGAVAGIRKNVGKNVGKASRFVGGKIKDIKERFPKSSKP